MKSNKGFTLIEVMIVIGLIGTMLLAMSGILNDNIIRFVQNTNYYKYKLDGRYAMTKVVNEVKKNYNTSFDSGKVLASNADILVNSNKNDLTGNIYFYYEPDKYGIADGYGELRGQGDSVLARNIKDFTIESINADLIKVTIKSGKENNKRIFQLTTYVWLYK